ncbi:MAG TPA: beta-N-acetylhexosaminidase [Candidatus Sulfopaludibacter sp.]|nr:beta-N-acetylhexosaminidase [Candidatus Sulfopaludibacter sp.]
MKIKSRITGILFCLTAAMAVAADTNRLAIIPWPQKVAMENGIFQLTPDTRVYADLDSRETAKFLTSPLRQATGYPFKTGTELLSGKAIRGAILLTTKGAGTNLGSEGYDLTVAPDSVVIRAPTQAGLFYGVQTLLQLLPPEVFSSTRVRGVSWQLSCVQIEDWPRFRWRGLLLDVSRHFFNKSEVETILDAMALHKLNVFHWHLTDDQGWRIEIKKYPKLTQIGAWRPSVGFGFDPKSTTAYGPDGRYGGFYTPADIREVVKYAAARHITVMPEIEMPGHSTAALAAYPQFSCTGGPFTMQLTGGIFDGIYDPAKPETFKFLDDVLSEVFELFPGQYVHLGGDEVPKETWQKSPDCQALMKREGLTNEDQLQGWFMRRVEKFVSAHGKTMVGWSEILQGGLASNAVVMDWIGGATEAARAGHDVVMSPTAYCYLDFYQSSNRVAEPPAATWGGPLTLRKVYSYEPMPANLPPQLQSHILGTQGNLWTEWVPNLKHAEYMIFPRECAIAEITWSSESARNWDDFLRRLRIHVQRLDQLGINYRHAAMENPEPDPLK